LSGHKRFPSLWFHGDYPFILQNTANHKKVYKAIFPEKPLVPPKKTRPLFISKASPLDEVAICNYYTNRNNFYPKWRNPMKILKISLMMGILISPFIAKPAEADLHTLFKGNPAFSQPSTFPTLLEAPHQRAMKEIIKIKAQITDSTTFKGITLSSIVRSYETLLGSLNNYRCPRQRSAASLIISSDDAEKITGALQQYSTVIADIQASLEETKSFHFRSSQDKEDITARLTSCLFSLVPAIDSYMAEALSTASKSTT
jgi:hypothetical protein